MLKRLSIYFQETVKPVNMIMTGICIGWGTHLMAQVLFQAKGPILTYHLLTGIISYILILLLWRAADEFKDYQTDMIYFPDRPIPSGRVRLGDLKVLILFIIILLIAVNMWLWNIAFGYFLVMFIYSLLMAKWFFLEKYLANNRLLALATHSPTTIISNYYLVAIYCNIHQYDVFTWATFGAVMWFSLPLLNWEFARKTWAPSEEMGAYQTYSRMIGYRLSALICLFLVAVQLILTAFLLMAYPFHWSLFAFTAVEAGVYFYFTVRFILNPELFNKAFRNYSALYVPLIYATMIIQCLIQLR